MTPLNALQILVQAQALAPLTEADRGQVYEAIKTIRPFVEPPAPPAPPGPPPGPGPVAPNPPVPPSV